MAPKLLLADDSVTVQRVIELTFADEGIQVVSVSDGQQAIDRAEEEPPDIILVDAGMPGRDGYDVAASVKSTPRLAAIPVVLMTGAFEQLDEARARAAGCDGILAKPFEPQMVIALVKQLLGLEPTGARTSAGPATRRPEASAGAPTAPPPEAVPLDTYLERLDSALTVATGGAAPRAPVLAPSEPTRRSSDRQPAPSLADAFSALLADELGETPAESAWGSLAGGAPPPEAVSLPEAVPPRTGASERVEPVAPADAVAVSEVDRPAAGVEGEVHAPELSEAQVDAIARRVAEQMLGTSMRDLVTRHVIEVAERLVREEIVRIKTRSPQ